MSAGVEEENRGATVEMVLVTLGGAAVHGDDAVRKPPALGQKLRRLAQPACEVALVRSRRRARGEEWNENENVNEVFQKLYPNVKAKTGKSPWKSFWFAC
jgi:hypothetical protein